ncbi:MAG: STAS domain-containing protein [Moraxella osloensis]|nr:STAS domain-containing protein [Moraxella osloensis]
MTDFHQSYIGKLDDIDHLVVDLKNLSTMDSSALGMLIVLRQRLLNRNIPIHLMNPNASVKNTLDIAKFGELFIII